MQGYLPANSYVFNKYGYSPSIAMNTIFVVLFAISLIAHTGQLVVARRSWFMTVMPIGCLLEVIGYAFRLYSHSDVAARSPYIGQLATLVIAPTFFSAALYWSLGLIIALVGPTKTFVSAKWFKIIFVVADIVSLVIQAIGGGSAGSAGDDYEKLRTGSRIMLAGIAFQLAVMVLFVFYGFYWSFRSRREISKAGSRMQLMLGALGVASACIIARGIFRTCELNEGFRGRLAEGQRFILVDAIPMIVCTLVLNAIHPAWFLVTRQYGNGSTSTSPFESKSKNQSETTFAPTNTPPSTEKVLIQSSSLSQHSAILTALGTMSGQGASRSNRKGKQRAAIVLDDEEDDYGQSRDYLEGATEEEREQVASLEGELNSLDEQISKLQELRSNLENDVDTVIATIQSRYSAQPRQTHTSTSSNRLQQPQNAVDFTKNGFEWSKEAKDLAREIWGVEQFRHCQEAAINAVVSGRDACVIMPTGGGKSLIYQIPALISEGCTIVITPLISLMTDQVQNLSDRDISAEAIHAATTQPDIRSIMKRMLGSAGAPKGKKNKVAVEDEEEYGGREIKLVYVTPERIDKSKSFVSTLQKMYDAGRISRFVIDEAHCITMSGHDYRPAYLSLQKLKVLFPKVPILAVTATAPSNVIADMIKTLGLPKKTCPGDAALPNSTILFTAPLYRPNLNWSVVAKPQKADQATSAIIDWILDNHEGETGIVYCLSRADSENVAKEINASAKCRGKLRAAVYHAYIDDAEKLRVHERWRDKKIQVVCATNASFGLGIDNPSVRYVVHHTLAKSLANYYQEGGRAGRDGLESDCISFFRPADASRLSTLVHESWRSGARDKLYEMLKFALDHKTCRKVLFARYFASTYDDSKAFDEEEGEEPCGSCDNCLRDSSTFEIVDISTQAYRALRIISAAAAQSGTLTLPQAGDLVRGNGGGSFSTKGDKNTKVKGKVDVTTVAGSKVTLNKEDCETMLLKLLVDGWLKEVFVNTAYATNSYLVTSEKALRFTRLTPSEFEDAGPPVHLTMEVPGGSGKGNGTKRKSNASSSKEGPSKKSKKDSGQSAGGPKRKRVDPSDDEDGEEGEEGEEEDYPVYGDEDEASSSRGDGEGPGSDPVVDEDGWTTIVKNGEVAHGSKKPKKVEVLELD
ncbi:hypothetical protein JCM16303_001150 [Sporobolomyces ruberrimus]